MATQGDETDEEYTDDPIELIDFEQKRINTLKKLCNNCQTEDLTDSDVEVVSDSTPLTKYKRICFTLPASFFTISKNLELLNGCQPIVVKLVDCIKHSSYYKKNIRRTNIDSDIIIIDDEINDESVEKVCESDKEDCIVISDSEKEEPDISLDEKMGKPKIRPVDITAYIKNNRININNSVQRTSETLKPNEKRENDKGILENDKRIDFKKNKGLVGLRIVQKANVDDRSKGLIGQKIVVKANVDKTKDCSNVEKEKSNKVDGTASQSCKPVHHDVNTLKVSSKSKLLETNTTIKEPESNSSTFNDKHNITNKECLPPNNTNSSKVYKETEKPSNVPEEINLTIKYDKQKSSTDTSETRKKNVEPNKTKNNREKKCISKYFKDVWDKDLRLALEPDTARLEKLNSSLKYIKDKLKIDKRKNRKENTKRVSNPEKLDTDNEGKVNYKKRSKKSKKTTKDREKSKKKDSIVSDSTKKDSKRNKSMPSLLLGEQIDTGKSQTENNISSKSTNKKTSEKSSKKKHKSEVQPISNPKNRDALNEKSQTSCKDSSKLVFNQLATQNTVDKKAERNKNNSEVANLGSSTVDYNLKRDVIDKDKPISTSTANNRINPGVMYKDKTSTLISTAVNKLLQAEKPLTSKHATTQQTINKNNIHPLNQKQNEDLNDKNRRASESLAKYIFYLESLKPNPVGGDLYLKHAVKPQECILSCNQVPDSKTHTVIGDVQNSSNSTGNNTSSAIGPMNSQQIPNQPSNKGLVPPVQTMPNNSTIDSNKPDAVKKSKKTLDDNNFNKTSSMRDLSHNTSSAIGPMNSQQIPNQPSNKGLVPPVQTMPNNSTNDCNKPDAVKKSKKTLDDTNFNKTSSMRDLPHNTSSAIGPMNSQQIPNQPSNKGLVPPVQTMPNNSTNDCNKPDAVKKSKKTLDDNNFNKTSSMRDLPHNTSSAIGPMNSQQIPNQPSNKGLVPPVQTMPNNSTNDCNKPDAVKKSKKTLDDNNFNKTSSMRDLPHNTSSAIGPMNSQQIPNQSSNKGLVPPVQTMPNNSTNDCNKPDAVKKSKKTLDDNNFNKTSSMRDLPDNTSSAIGPLNSQQIPNQPSNKGLVPPVQTMPNNSTNDSKKPDAVKKSKKTLDDNNFNMTSSMQDLSHNTASAIGPKNSQQIPNQPSNKVLIPPAQTMPNNSTNDCNNPDALKKSNNTCDDNMTNSTMQDNPEKSNLVKEIDTATSIKSEVSIKQEDPPENSNLPPINPRVSENQLPHQARICQDDNNNASYPKDTNSTETQQEPNFPRVAKNDHLRHVRLKSNTAENRLNSNINTTGTPLSQQTANQGRINEEHGKPIEAFVTNRKHKRKLGIAPQVSMKDTGNLNTFPHGVIHCAPIYHGAPLNMPQGDQNQFWVYNPSPPLQGNPTSHAQPPMSQLSPQKSQPLPQMSQTSPKILQHSPQMSQPSQQMPPPSTQMLQHSRQMPQPSRQTPQPLRQIPQPSRQMPQPSQQMPQSSPKILQHSPLISQPSRQMPQSSQQMRQSSQQMPQSSPKILQHSRQMLQPSRQMPQPSQQMPRPLQQMPQPSPQMRQPLLQTPQPSSQMRQPLLQTPQPSQQMPQPSRQMPQPSRQMPQPSQQMPQSSLQMPQSSQQISRPPSQMLHPVPQMSLPPSQMWHSEFPEFSYCTPQMSHNMQPQFWHPPPQIPHQPHQMYHPELHKSHLQLQMSQPRQQMSNCDLIMSYPQTQNSNLCLCGKCQTGFTQMPNLPPQTIHPPPRMLNRHQEMPHFTQCLSNPGPQISHTLPTSQRISNPQSQISHLPQQISNPAPQVSNPPVKYDNVAQSVSGSTIIGRNNAGVVRKINIVAAHSKGLPSLTEAKLNIEDVTPVESEKEMFEELCKIRTLESPMKEDSKSKKDLKRKLSKDDKIGESTPNRRPRKVKILKKKDAMQDLKTSSERALPVPHKGYSPPILPIATFEKTFEILAQANIELFGNFRPITNKTIPILRKRRCLSFDERRDDAKKISIDEYKKKSPGRDNKAIDFVGQHRKVDQNGGQNPEQDLGYDSDTTMKQ